MIAYVPPLRVREHLASLVKGGEAADDLHLTLCFFPDYDALDISAVLEAMERVSVAFPTLPGKINGVGRFSTEDGDAIVALVDAPYLSTLREALTFELRELGVEYANNHGFTPHIIIAYLKPGQQSQPITRIDPIPIMIRSISIFSPETELGEIALSAEKEVGTKQSRPFPASNE